MCAGEKWDAVAPPDTFNFYHQLGNVAIIGYNGAPSADGWSTNQPFFQEACAWVGAQPGLDVVTLVGHWDEPKMGAKENGDVPGAYKQIRTMPGCDKFEVEKTRLERSRTPQPRQSLPRTLRNQ